MPKEEAASPLPVLLGFLMPGPAHAYELYRDFDRGLGRVWRIGQSKAYAYLKEIEAEGLASVAIEEQESLPARRVYSLTAAGRLRFLDWLRGTTPQARNIRLEFLARLYFYRELGLEGIEELVAAQEAVLVQRMAALQLAMRESGDEYWRLVLDFRRSEMGAIVSWLGRCARSP